MQNCGNCGVSISNVTLHGYGGKAMCSRKCQDEDEKRYQATITAAKAKRSESSSSSPLRGIVTSFINDNEDNLPKTAAEIEAEEREEQAARERDAKDEAARKIKAEEYRKQGRPFIAWVVGMNPLFALALFGWPFFFCFAPGDLKLIGIITLVIFAFLFVKDLLKMSWKLFSIILVVLILSFVGLVFYIKEQRANKREHYEKEFNDQMKQLGFDETSTNETSKASSTEAAASESSPQENTQESTTTVDRKDHSELIGEWNGTFGKDQLTINIESVDESGNVVGYDEVKGNRRVLSGNLEGETFVLKEPGDDKWDGVFTFTIKDNKAVGIWAANNGKSTKNFALTK